MALPGPGAVLHLHVYSWLIQVGQPSLLRASAHPCMALTCYSCVDTALGSLPAL